jgi:chaperone modulatory protein CbpM
MHPIIHFLDDVTTIDFAQLVERSGLAPAEVIGLVEFGVFQPEGEAPSQWLFAGRALALARRAARLRADFELNLAGLALALTYLERIETLEGRVRELECLLLR